MDIPEQLIRPEDFWPVDPHFQRSYELDVRAGRMTASQMEASIVMIARNARPHLENTLMLLEEVRDGFGDSRVYAFENDSTDGTGEVLERYARSAFGVVVERETLGGADHRGFSDERTNRLAYCRNRCLEWVRKNHTQSAYTIVIDCDPHGGFSVDGVFSSIAQLGMKMAADSGPRAGGMAAYSAMRSPNGRGPGKVIHYDAWAARMNDWRDRREEVGFEWFHWLLPAVGSPPIPMYSAFGGLAVYWTKAYLSGGYAGGDCEHVLHHRKMRESGWSMWLNPGMRYVAW